MTSSDRKTNGVFYTAPSVVRYIVRATLQPLLNEGRLPNELAVLDPACGDGVFLRESVRFLSRESAGPPERLIDQVFGIDIDGQAVDSARRQLAAEFAGVASTLRKNLLHADALLGPDAVSANSPGLAKPPSSVKRLFPEVCAKGGFDAVVGNPPYVNIRILTKTHPAKTKQYLSENFLCARGAYDLYVLFLEQAHQLLRPGGICGMIVPNKVAEMEYARACRQLLLERTSLLQIVDVSSLKLFQEASVFPYILIWKKERPRAGHTVTVKSASEKTSLRDRMPAMTIKQSRLSAERGFDLHGALDIESRVATQPLELRAALCSGTTGFVAERLAREVVERDTVTGAGYHDFIVSRNIDRFLVRRGDVRFMKRQFRSPVVPSHSAVLSQEKKRLFRGKKIVVAGMTRRLEAAWDSGGLALGVQVYAVAAMQDDPYFLLGLLNSKLMSYIFQLRFRAKRLSGGYFAVNKRQLEQLPIRVWKAGPTASGRHLSELAQRMLELSRHGRNGASAARIDSEIDGLVYRMYKVSHSEIERIEATIR